MAMQCRYHHATHVSFPGSLANFIPYAKFKTLNIYIFFLFTQLVIPSDKHGNNILLISRYYETMLNNVKERRTCNLADEEL